MNTTNTDIERELDELLLLLNEFIDEEDTSLKEERPKLILLQ